MHASVNAAESFLSGFFDTYCARGQGRVRIIARNPSQLLHAWRAISELPVLEAKLSTSAEAAAVRRGLLRTNAAVRGLIRGTTAVLQIPEDGASYLVGSNESKRSLRTKMRRADRQGFTVSMPVSREERLELLRLSEAYERNHPDPTYRNDKPRLDHLEEIRTWLVARDATRKPLLVAVVPVDGDWGVLAYFKTLESSDSARLARHWLSGVLVQHLSEIGVRYLADESSPVGLPTGLRSFQRRLGYRLVRVRIGGRPTRERVLKRESNGARPLGLIGDTPHPGSRISAEGLVGSKGIRP
ncbi:hypothetical protein MNAB215_4187 [Mycobacterium numidiamassiliense]|uniref:Uncharacterized protein n=1 Tax=Mycobacterium numidiamassiliense TaxID=1841861 RepID=A0A2U3PDZ4_9MYCO|nr:hypothetical protein [Mycobacterium numidiamassiliense]SPM41969.1 hypothetical protein MNAB215_4187 [Mycobacterium numidiamassiliense]